MVFYANLFDDCRRRHPSVHATQPLRDRSTSQRLEEIQYSEINQSNPTNQWTSYISCVRVFAQNQVKTNIKPKTFSKKKYSKIQRRSIKWFELSQLKQPMATRINNNIELNTWYLRCSQFNGACEGMRHPVTCHTHIRTNRFNCHVALRHTNVNQVSINHHTHLLN